MSATWITCHVTLRRANATIVKCQTEPMQSEPKADNTITAIVGNERVKAKITKVPIKRSPNEFVVEATEIK